MPALPWFNGCCDGSGETVATTPLFRQARLLADDSLADVWLPSALLPDQEEDFVFFNPEDEVCYYIDFDDDPSDTPGTVLAGWEAIDDAAEQAYLCGGCTSEGFAWDTGAVSEPDEAGEVFLRQSPALVLNAAPFISGYVFTATSDDFVILLKHDQTIGQSWSGTPGDPVTFTVPADAIIFRNTGGSLISATTCEKTLTDGTNSYTVPEGNVGNAGTGAVIDVESATPAAIPTRDWTDPVTVTELEAKGWIDPDGKARVRFWHIVCGNGYSTITDMQCQATWHNGLRHTGEGLEPEDPDAHWQYRTYGDGSSPGAWVGTYAIEKDAAWVAPISGSHWINFDDTTTPSNTVVEWRLRVTITEEKTGLVWPFKFASDNDVIDVFVNGNSTGINNTGVEYNPLTDAELEWGDGFDVGENEIVFRMNEGGIIGGFYLWWDRENFEE